jgi:hypothetical protein
MKPEQYLAFSFYLRPLLERRLRYLALRPLPGRDPHPLEHRAFQDALYEKYEKYVDYWKGRTDAEMLLSTQRPAILARRYRRPSIAWLRRWPTHLQSG